MLVAEEKIVESTAAGVDKVAEHVFCWLSLYL